MREDQMRIAIQSAAKLNDAMASQARTCTLMLEHTKGLADIKNLLVAEGTGACNVMLVVPVKSGVRAEIVLPGRWRLSPQTVSAMHRVSGVKSVAEG